MKRIVLALLVLALLAPAVLIPAASPARAEPLKIAMVLWRGETAAERGFRDELDKMGYEAEFDMFDAARSQEALTEILAELKGGGYDYYYVFGTTASLAAKKALGKNARIIFNVVRFPKKSGLVKDLAAPGGNICGVSNNVPAVDILRTARKFFPVATLGTVYNVTESNSRQEYLALERCTADAPLNTLALGVMPESEALERALNLLVSPEAAALYGLDALYFGPDSFVMANLDLLGPALARTTLPSIGASEELVRAGALFGLVPDYEVLGRQAAFLLDRMENGAKPGDLPVAMPRKVRTLINRATLERLGLNLPEAELRKAELID